MAHFLSSTEKEQAGGLLRVRGHVDCSRNEVLRTMRTKLLSENPYVGLSSLAGGKDMVCVAAANSACPGPDPPSPFPPV